MRARTLSFIGAVGVLLLASAGPADAAFAPDASFDDDGAVVIDDSGVDMGMGVTTANGATYVAYSDFGGHVNVARLTLQGDLDATWGGGDGMVETSLLGQNRADVLVLANGKVLVAGGGNASGLGLGVVRLTAAGVPDTTFSGDGKAVRTAANVGGGRQLAVDAVGRIYVAGNREQVFGPGDMASDFAVARFRANGTLDNTFSSDAIAYVNHRRVDLLSDLAVDRSGRVLLMGDSKQGVFDLQGGVGLVARLRANGSLDPTYSGDGKMTFTFGGNATVIGLGGGVDGSNRVVFGVTNMQRPGGRRAPDRGRGARRRLQRRRSCVRSVRLLAVPGRCQPGGQHPGLHRLGHRRPALGRAADRHRRAGHGVRHQRRGAL